MLSVDLNDKVDIDAKGFIYKRGFNPDDYSLLKVDPRHEKAFMY